MDLNLRVIKAAIEQFDIKGIHFTMDDLSGILGVSKRTIYEQIGNKEAIIQLVIEEAFSSIKQQEKKIVSDDNLDVVEKLKRVITIMPALSGILDYRRIYEIQKYYPKLYQLIEEHLHEDWQVTLSLLEEGIEQGRIKSINLFVFKEMIFATMDRLLRNQFLLEHNLTYDEALQEAMAILFDGILCKEIA